MDFTRPVRVQAWGSQAEYLDPEIDFYNLWDQINQYLTQGPETRVVRFSVWMSNLSVTSMEYLFSGILGLRHTYNTTHQRVEIITSVVNDPPWHDPQILPMRYADHLDELWAWMLRQRTSAGNPWHGFLDHEIQRMDDHIAWIRQGCHFNTELLHRHRADFYRYWSQRDATHGLEFTTVFPEMRDWWQLCQECADRS